MWDLIKIILYFIRNLICAFVSIVGGTIIMAVVVAIIGVILALPSVVVFWIMVVGSVIVICLLGAIDEVK